MPDPDRCELHEVALFTEGDEAEALTRLAQSPIGDECQICMICRAAREYVERKRAEQAGYRPPAGESADVSWGKLQSAIASAKSTIHRTA
jgi:hypothetical protein